MKKRQLIYIFIWIGVLLVLGLIYFLGVRQGLIKPKAAATTPTLALSPTTGSYQLNSIRNVLITIDTAGQYSDGVNAIIKYDPNYLTVTDASGNPVTSITAGTFFGNPLTNTVVTTPDGNGLNTIKYSEMVSLGDTAGKTGAGTIASFYIKVIRVGTTTVSFANTLPNPNLDFNYSQISNHLTSVITTPTNILGAVINGSYTVINNVTFTISLTLQGKAAGSYAATGIIMNVLTPGQVCDIMSPTCVPIARSSTVSVDNNGNGTVVLNGIGNGTYDLDIKVPYYLSLRKNAVVVSNNAATVNFAQQATGDLNNNNQVNNAAYQILNLAWGSAQGDTRFNPIADIYRIDALNQVNAGDYQIFNTNYTRTGN